MYEVIVCIINVKATTGRWLTFLELKLFYLEPRRAAPLRRTAAAAAAAAGPSLAAQLFP